MTARNLSSLFGGLIFGVGLVVSGMTNPEKVLAFLTLGSSWEPALIIVMGSAVAVATVGYWVIGKRAAPIFDVTFRVPTKTVIDGRLLAGSSLFGIGWGLSGFCPGPALVALMTLDQRGVVFVLAYAAGVVLHDKLLGKAMPGGAITDG